MNYLKIKYTKNLEAFYKIFLLILFFLLTFNNFLFAKELIIKGNEFSDDEVIFSLIDKVNTLDEKTKYNYILKELNKSGLFKSVEIKSDENNIFIHIEEFPSINKIYYENNERVKSEDIDKIVYDMSINTLSENNINNLIDELKNIYRSYGYNNIQINYRSEILNNNSSLLFIEFIEGDITKINKINFNGNNNFNNNLLLSKIKSKTKKLTNIFANNNFKIYQINNDVIRLKKFYDSQGYIDSKINFEIEYFQNNRVIVNFKIAEGKKYYFSSIKIKNNLQDNVNIENKLNEFLDSKNKLLNTPYDKGILDSIEFEITDVLNTFGEEFFEIKTYQKNSELNVDILFEVVPIKPIYINQINIYGNTRTFDYVIRRELDVAEGDPINSTKLKKINKKLNQLTIFKNIEVNNIKNLNNTDNLNIEVEETQTGSFNVGLSIGTLDGASFVSGLKERNINGTGRSVEFLINTNENNKAFTLSTSEKFFLNNKVKHKYSTNYKENDYTSSKSYKSNTLNIDTDLYYSITDNIFHTIGIGYELKDYIVTNSSTVSEAISKSSGESISYNLKNELTYNTLNSFIRPTNGTNIRFLNNIQTPTSSTNGYIQNVLTYKKYYDLQNDIFSIQSRFGNISSLNDSEILSDDKFSLGGRWLRGFDNYGAGPRGSRSSYVGGNNLIVTKLDYSKPLSLNDENPIYLNLFNDYGLLWGNKNDVTNSDQSLRASYGFGINYYSPIGPIGFSWGYPLLDKDYDIKRMFTFTIGNLN